MPLAQIQSAICSTTVWAASTHVFQQVPKRSQTPPVSVALKIDRRLSESFKRALLPICKECTLVRETYLQPTCADSHVKHAGYWVPDQAARDVTQRLKIGKKTDQHRRKGVLEAN